MSEKPTENTSTAPVKIPLSITSFKAAVICTCIFFIIQLIGIVHHSPWRDEFQAFQIAMNSHSISDLFYNMRQEGHGAVWYLLLYVITRFTHDIFAMQLVHIIIASTTIFILFRYSPFKLFEKVLISLGYFFIFEYAQVSREYSIGVFCIICICSVMGEKYYKRKLQAIPALTPSLFYIISCFLVVLADTSLFGLIMSGALAAYFLWIILDERKYVLSNKKIKGALGLSALLLFAGWAFSIFQMMPPADSSFSSQFHPGSNLSDTGKTLTQLIIAYLPFPPTTIPFWNGYYIWPDRSSFLTITSLIVIAVIVFLFIKKPKLVFLYLICIIGLGAFLQYANIIIASRFLGHSFLALFICFWFDRYIPSNQNILPLIPDSVIDILKKSLFYLLLSLQAITGIYFYYLGLTQSFTNCTKAGEYIMKNHLDRFPLIGSDDFIVCPLSYYTNKPTFTFNRNDTSRFVIWDDKRNSNITFQSLLNMMVSQINSSPNDTCLLCMDVKVMCNNNEFNPFAECDLDATHALKLIYQIEDPSMVPTDNYYFYYMWKK